MSEVSACVETAPMPLGADGAERESPSTHSTVFVGPNPSPLVQTLTAHTSAKRTACSRSLRDAGYRRL